MIFICKDTKRFNTNATCAEHGERSSRLVLQIGSQILTTRGDDAPKDLRLNLEAESPLSLIMLNELTQSDVSTLSRCKTKCVIGINRYRFHRSWLIWHWVFWAKATRVRKSPLVRCHVHRFWGSVPRLASGVPEKDHPALQEGWILGKLSLNILTSILWEKKRNMGAGWSAYWPTLDRYHYWL